MILPLSPNSQRNFDPRSWVKFPVTPASHEGPPRRCEWELWRGASLHGLGGCTSSHQTKVLAPVITPRKSDIWVPKAIKRDASDRRPESHLGNTVIEASCRSLVTQSSVIKPRQCRRSPAVCTVTAIFLHTRAPKACSALASRQKNPNVEEQQPLTVGEAPRNPTTTEKRSFSTRNQSLVPGISRSQPLAACSSQAINVSDHQKPKLDEPLW